MTAAFWGQRGGDGAPTDATLNNPSFDDVSDATRGEDAAASGLGFSSNIRVSYPGALRSDQPADKRFSYLNTDISYSDGQSKTEVLDHLIPVSLGGTDSVENLWPEPEKGDWNATQKDALEHKLLTMVCDGTLTVKQAQTAIKKNWVAAYQQYVGAATVATKDQ